MTLSTALIAYETEEAARRRLEAFGYAPAIAAEIAVYLAQSTDLPGFVEEIAGVLGKDGVEAWFTPLDELSLRLRDLKPRRAETIVWALTDGVRFYRGNLRRIAEGLEPSPRRLLGLVGDQSSRERHGCSKSRCDASATGRAAPLSGG